jgi:two-component system CheB/CheR fusion protein
MGLLWLEKRISRQQRTTEELETSKEELQSINEELQTVNSELRKN